VDGVAWDKYGTMWIGGLPICTPGFIARAAGRYHRSGGTYRSRTGGSALFGVSKGGIASAEDKIVQRDLVEVLNAIYEEDFLGLSPHGEPSRAVGKLVPTRGFEPQTY
jgi:RNA-directed DNA polymerase